MCFIREIIFKGTFHDSVEGKLPAEPQRMQAIILNSGHFGLHACINLEQISDVKQIAFNIFMAFWLSWHAANLFGRCHTYVKTGFAGFTGFLCNILEIPGISRRPFSSVA